MNAFNLIFAGTPEFAAISLEALIHSQHTVKAVFTQPDRPAGRGRHLTASPVKTLSLQHGLPIYQPLTLKDKEEQKKLADLQADIMIVVAYGLLLPPPVLTIPRLGCINIHASLLPRWRGAAPIQRAILAGDNQTGVTIMQMDAGLDTGPMLYQQACIIAKDDTSETLHHRLALLGKDTLLRTLANLSELKPIKQNDQEATYAHKIKKEEAILNWNLPAEVLAREIRAFYPWPISFFDHIRVFQAEALDNTAQNKRPGTIIQASHQGIDVATGRGVLRLLKLQLPGGKALPAKDILNARKKDFEMGRVL